MVVPLKPTRIIWAIFCSSDAPGTVVGTAVDDGSAVAVDAAVAEGDSVGCTVEAGGSGGVLPGVALDVEVGAGVAVLVAASLPPHAALNATTAAAPNRPLRTKRRGKGLSLLRVRSRFC
jgi:hypothetical protein